MNNETNLYKRVVLKNIEKNPSEKSFNSKNIYNHTINRMLKQHRASIKNKNNKNIQSFRTSNKILKNSFLDSKDERRTDRLDKTIEIKGLKNNSLEKKFPNIIQYHKNSDNRDSNIFFQVRKHSKTQSERIKRNPMQALLHYYRLIKLYKLKGVLLNKSKLKNDQPINFIIKNANLFENNLNKNENNMYNLDYKIINLRIPNKEDSLNKENESEEDIDKDEKILFNLIKGNKNMKTKKNVNVKKRDEEEKTIRMINLNTMLKKKNLSYETEKEKKYLEDKGKIINYKKSFFHNKFLKHLKK